MFVEMPLHYIETVYFEKEIKDNIKKKIKQIKKQLDETDFSHNNYCDKYWLKGKAQGYKEILELIKNGF